MPTLYWVRLWLYIASSLAAAAIVGRLTAIKIRLAWALAVCMSGWVLNSGLFLFLLITDYVLGARHPLAEWFKTINAVLLALCPILLHWVLGWGQGQIGGKHG